MRNNIIYYEWELLRFRRRLKEYIANPELVLNNVYKELYGARTTDETPFDPLSEDKSFELSI